MTYLKWMILFSAAVAFLGLVRAAFASPTGAEEVLVNFLETRAKPPLDLKIPPGIKTATFALG